MEYVTILVVSFLSATVLPLGSEALLLFYAAQEANSLVLLWSWATIGNSIGAVTTWLLGAYLTRFEGRRWFPVDSKKRIKAEYYFNRYGVWSLLFTWLPIIGDGIALAAGVFRTSLWYFIPLVVLGKASRYALILWGQHLIYAG
ncbi:YqaA family protein [Marinomonas sp. TW1]|uniref:YqaA family protein n=1 Tax=Marinomonas sp. TW1 TaxID=1561203 RepID=UPI0007AFC799|nr:YqaA family protein [Marinomonas sp. TW1]KZN14079.1 membrane protein [Marinomonas sp. TW1]